MSTPPQRVGARWMTLFTLAWLAIWMVQLTPVQYLLPLQLDQSDENWTAGVVSAGIVLGVGGLAGVVAAPAIGAVSDRSRSPWGRRRPWAVAGVWLAAVCLALTGLAQGAWAVGACWVGVSVGVAVASAAFTALIADQLPPHQRGAASSAIGSSQAVSIVIGVGLMVLLGLSIAAEYLLLAGIVAVFGTAAALLLPDPPPGPAEPSARDRVRFDSLRDRDFGWMLGGRLIANVGNALGTALLFFYLRHGLGQPKGEADDNLLLLIVIYTVFVVIASVIAGIVSDRTGRRRGLTALSAMVQALSGVLLVVAPSFETTLFAAALMGLGYGGFSTVGLAFATDLLPDERDHARDLGIVNVAAALGQLSGPLLGALFVVLSGGFWLVFLMAAVLSVAGGVMTGIARQRAPVAARR